MADVVSGRCLLCAWRLRITKVCGTSFGKRSQGLAIVGVLVVGGCGGWLCLSGVFLKVERQCGGLMWLRPVDVAVVHGCSTEEFRNSRSPKFRKLSFRHRNLRAVARPIPVANSTVGGHACGSWGMFTVG